MNVFVSTTRDDVWVLCSDKKLYWASQLAGPYHAQSASCGISCNVTSLLSGDGYELLVSESTAWLFVTKVKNRIDMVMNTAEHQEELDANSLAIYQKSDIEIDSSLLKPMSNDYQQLEYLLEDSVSGEFIVVTSPQVIPSYDFVVYRGKPHQMQRINGQPEVERFRDGGTTHITCADFSVTVRARCGGATLYVTGGNNTNRFSLIQYQSNEAATVFCKERLGMDVTLWCKPVSIGPEFARNKPLTAFQPPSSRLTVVPRCPSPPPPPHRSLDSGAYVRPFPTRNFNREPVIVLDFASLYPSITLAQNF
jgi:hypothetical protein